MCLHYEYLRNRYVLSELASSLSFSNPLVQFGFIWTAVFPVWPVFSSSASLVFPSLLRVWVFLALSLLPLYCSTDAPPSFLLDHYVYFRLFQSIIATAATPTAATPAAATIHSGKPSPERTVTVVVSVAWFPAASLTVNVTV